MSHLHRLTLAKKPKKYETKELRLIFLSTPVPSFLVKSLMPSQKLSYYIVTLFIVFLFYKTAAHEE